MTTLDAILTVPEAWIVCSLDAAIDAKQIPAQVDERIKHRRRLKSYRKLMTTAANDWAERCRHSGSMAAALRWDVLKRRQTPVCRSLPTSTSPPRSPRKRDW